MAIGDLYRMALGYRIHGQQNVNVFHMKQVADAESENANQVATAVLPLLAATYAGIIAGIGFDKAFNLQVVKVSRIFSDMGEQSGIFDLTYANNVSLPTVNAVTCSIYTGLAGPSRRGRVFLGGVAVDSVLNSVIAAQGPTRYAAFITAFTGRFLGEDATSGYQLGVFSRKRYAITSNPFDDYWKPANRVQVQNEIGTMHSRKIGVGS